MTLCINFMGSPFLNMRPGRTSARVAASWTPGRAGGSAAAPGEPEGSVGGPGRQIEGTVTGSCAGSRQGSSAAAVGSSAAGAQDGGLLQRIRRAWASNFLEKSKSPKTSAVSSAAAISISSKSSMAVGEYKKRCLPVWVVYHTPTIRDFIGIAAIDARVPACSAHSVFKSDITSLRSADGTESCWLCWLL